MSKRQSGARPQAEETCREDGHRPSLYEERLPEIGHEVCRLQKLLCELWAVVQSALDRVVSACLRPLPPGLDDLPESRPSTALAHHHSGDRTLIRYWVKQRYRREFPTVPV